MIARQLTQSKRLYDTIDAAFENQGNNHGINPHKYLADILGNSGQDKDKQLYRKLSQKEPNYRFYLDELVMMCEALGVYSSPLAHFFFSYVRFNVNGMRVYYDMLESLKQSIQSSFVTCFSETCKTQLYLCK